jgi:hypothetical protein
MRGANNHSRTGRIVDLMVNHIINNLDANEDGT